MAVFRVEKTSNYTVMSNYHLKERKMSLKAKGLLSVMLSLPSTWDYSLNGLVAISKENLTAIRSALDELKEFGYLKMVRHHENGRYNWEYLVYEEPIQQCENQHIENLYVENQHIENITQLNTHTLNTHKPSKYKLEDELKPSKSKKSTKEDKSLEMKKMVRNFSEDTEVNYTLAQYVEIRKKKGLEPVQLKIILEDLKKVCKTPSTQLAAIRNAIAAGWSAIVYPNTNTGNYSKPHPDTQTAIANKNNEQIKDYSDKPMGQRIISPEARIRQGIEKRKKEIEDTL